MAAGVAALFLAAQAGVTAWNVIAGLVGLPLLTLAALRWLDPRDRSASACNDSGCSEESPRLWRTEFALLALVTLVAIVVSLLTPINDGAVWTWLTASFLLSSILGESGCEMASIPNLLTGKRHRFPCFLFHAIDRLESRRRMRSQQTSSA